MSYKDICMGWVEERKWEDDEGKLFIVDPDGEVQSGPYTDTEIDDILWDRAVSGEAIENILP